MHRYAVVKDNICVGVVETKVPQLHSDKVEIGETVVKIGSTLANGVWTAPQESPIETARETALNTMKTVSIIELDKTDIGKAVKALLQNADLIK